MELTGGHYIIKGYGLRAVDDAIVTLLLIFVLV